MKKFYKVLTGMMCAAGLLASSSGAQAELAVKQVGTPSAGSTSMTSNLPVYVMSKYGQGISIYKKDAIGLPANTVIKELTWVGYQKEEKDLTDATIEVWVANASATSKYADFIKTGEQEGTTATTVLDESKATLFYTGSFTVPVGGSQSDPIDVLKITSSTEGFTYTGDGIMIYINIATPKCSGLYTNFVTATASGTLFAANGAYRDSGYASDSYGGGYGVNTKIWREYGSKQMPVVKLGYEGERQKISAEISGKVLSSLNNSGLSGAAVSLTENGTAISTLDATPSSGQFSFKVDDVKDDATYALVASKEGFEAANQAINIKAGGTFTNQNITLTKLPVPATVSGKVIDKTTHEPIAGAYVTFNNDAKTTGADGAYSFDIANIDLLPSDGLLLKASATGYNAYSTTLNVTADMTFNIEMVALPPLPGEGAQIGEYNTVSYDYVSPFNPLWNFSMAETIYPKGILGNLQKDAKYSSISFFGYLNPVSSGTGSGDGDGDGDDDDYNDYWTAPAKADAEETPYKGNVKIYMVNTTASRFTNPVSATDLSSLTPLFEGEVTIHEGGKNNDPALLFTADFTEPFEYAGDNIKLICVTENSNSRLVYFAFDTTYSANIIGKAQSTQAAFETASLQLYNQGVPVIRLGDFVPTAVVSGVVSDKNTGAPLEGAVVTLAKGTDKVNATTDAEGAYSISWRGVAYDETYTLNVEKAPYDELTQDITFTEATLTRTVDAQLTVSGVISGKVTDKVTGNALADMTVKVFTADNTEVTIDAEEAKTADDGTYTVILPEADFATYFVEVSGGIYTAAKKEISFSPEQVEVDDVDFAMEYDATVSGTVKFSDGVNVAGAIVTMGTLTATTDADGHYSIPFAPVTEAQAAVKVTYENEEVYTGTADLTGSNDITFNITLDMSGIAAVMGAEGIADVYAINGTVVARDADMKAVKALPAGIYIVNGHKVVISK